MMYPRLRLGPRLGRLLAAWAACRRTACRPTVLLPGYAGAERAWRQASPGAKQAFDDYAVLSVDTALHDKFLDKTTAR